MGRISKWFPPFTGVIFAVLFVVINVLTGQGQDATKKTPQEIVNYYNDHYTKHVAGVILIVFAATFILYFGGWLRRVLRDAEGPDGILSAVVFGAVIVFSAGAAIAGSIHMALVDLADDLNPIAVQAINGIDYDLFFFFPVGLGTLFLATGISALRHGALPKWLAWASVVLGVVSFTPAFFVMFFVSPLWFLIVAIWGMRREARAGPAPAAA
jgi:hypothetical protein